jgi:hypothetical protein
MSFRYWFQGFLFANMPKSVVRDVAQRCKLNKLRSWESNLKSKNNLSCEKLGEAVASIVKNKMKKNSTFSRETEEGVYQSLFHVDYEDAMEILKLEEYKEDTKKTFDIKGKEVFSAGNWKKDKYTEQDLDAMIEAFNKLDFKPALKLHHEKNDENDITTEVNLLNPALGYVSNLYRKGKKLLADFSGIPKKVYEAIQNKAYNRVSSEIAWNFKRNGKTFKRALCAVSLLGADIPAVADLETLNGLYSYSEDDELHIYDLQNDNDEKLVDFGGVLDWDDTKDSYIYWAYKYDISRNQIDNVSKEDIGDGVMKLFKTREIMDNETLENETIKDIIGWQFAKNKYNLAQAKAWIGKRQEPKEIYEVDSNKWTHTSKEFNFEVPETMDSLNKEFQTSLKEEKETTINPIPESARGINNKNNNYEEEDIMADELKETLEALQKQLSESQQKIEKLEARDIELETKEKQFAEKEIEFSKEKEDLETKLKETEEKQKEFDEKVKKLSEENEKFVQDKQEAERKARETEIKAFVDENKTKGKILPRFENYIKSLLSIEDTEKVCKFSVKEGDKEVEKEFSVSEITKELVKSLPDSAQLKELSVQEEDTTGAYDIGDKLDKAVKAYAAEHKMKYSEAWDIVLQENPQLKQEYAASTQ